MQSDAGEKPRPQQQVLSPAWPRPRSMGFQNVYAKKAGQINGQTAGGRLEETN